MEDQKLPLSIPSEWEERFLIKRIDEEDIIISLEERNSILDNLRKGMRFVQIGKYTLMLNSIKSIDPFYEPNNIPPKPDVHETIVKKYENNKAIVENIGKEKLELWEKLFGYSVKQLEDGKRMKEIKDKLNGKKIWKTFDLRDL